MSFDSNRAWQDASAAVRANREVLAVLAGVFVLLPTLAVAVLCPLPVPPAGASQEKIAELILAWLGDNRWWLLGMVVAYDLGGLAMLSLLRDHARPTVGEAIGQALGGLVPLLLARLMTMAVLLVVFMLVLGLTALAGAMAGATLGAVLCLAITVYALIRTAMVAPLIAKEGLRTPHLALRRSWQLTKGHVAGIGLFFGLVWIAYQVVSFIITKVVDLVALQVAGAGPAAFVTALAGSLLAAVFSTYIAAMLGATHRQLAHPAGSGAIPHG